MSFITKVPTPVRAPTTVVLPFDIIEPKFASELVEVLPKVVSSFNVISPPVAFVNTSIVVVSWVVTTPAFANVDIVVVPFASSVPLFVNVVTVVWALVVTVPVALFNKVVIVVVPNVFTSFEFVNFVISVVFSVVNVPRFSISAAFVDISAPVLVNINIPFVAFVSNVFISLSTIVISDSL